MSENKLEERILDKLPLDRRLIFSEINKGCDPKLLKYLVSHFWVTEETDSNDDLGFVFALKPLDVTGESLDGFYKLYVSCVLKCVTMRLYTLDSEGNSSSSSIALSDEYLEQTMSTRLLKKAVVEFGYDFITDRELSKEMGAEVLNKSGLTDGSYFNLLFSEY